MSSALSVRDCHQDGSITTQWANVQLWRTDEFRAKQLLFAAQYQIGSAVTKSGISRLRFLGQWAGSRRFEWTGALREFCAGVLSGSQACSALAERSVRPRSIDLSERRYGGLGAHDRDQQYFQHVGQIDR
jgi:hypothetical protein